MDKNKNFVIDKSVNPKFGNTFKCNWPGSFQVHDCGESDLRAVYCALVVADVLDIGDDEFYKGIAENIAMCQTFEGGLGPEPYCEAHGGYSYCGFASLILLNRTNAINIDKFIHWLVNRQMTVEGGFQGRTNKLVDSCYSFWQGSVFNMLLDLDKAKYSVSSEMLFDQYSLQAYILMACQHYRGGLVDKPGKNPDLFHTNYASAGLALSQQSLMEDLNICISYDESCIFEELDPVYCVSKQKVIQARSHFIKN